MSIGHTAVAAPPVEVASGTAFALLVALAGASRDPREELAPELRAALAAVGDTEGESWLNLLGVPLDAGAPYTAEPTGRASSQRCRRSSCGGTSSVGTPGRGARSRGSTTSKRPPRVTPRRRSRLLAHPRYYGGHASSSLSVLLALDPVETRRRLAAAIDAGARTLLHPSAADEIATASESAAGALAARPPLEAIERVAAGYRYVPEPEAERVVLVPHLTSSLPLVLAQHRSSRLIAYRATADRDSEERLLAFGRALADPKRVEILALVGRGMGRAADLVDATGLTRSTVHHHLAQLRDAGLVALEGNARAYTYVPRRAAADDAAALVADIIGTEEE